MGTIIQMTAVSAGGTEDSLASIDVPLSGNLIGVAFAGYAIVDTTADRGIYQVSFGSAYSGANDARQVIANATFAYHTFLTAVGDAFAVVNSYVPLPDISVGMGERIHLHCVSAAGFVASIWACLHFDFDLDKMPTRRR